MQSNTAPIRNKTWGELYFAALFETDPAALHERIAEAERALLLRVRELSGARGDHIEEQESMDDALYALRALGSAQRSQPAVTLHRAA